MADDDRREGDWQRKDQRKDANDLLRTPGAKPWHQQVFWIIVLLVVFWPVGIVLCWKSDWHIAFKIIATILVVGVTYLSWSLYQATLQLTA